jgi:glucose-1-phosphate cytidylyltransferase
VAFRQGSSAVASLLLVQPTASFDVVNAGPGGTVRDICPLRRGDIWINGGFFVMRREQFRHRHTGEELVRAPFQRLIQKQALLAYKYSGFWQCMDTFKDKERLEELNQGVAPWKVWNHLASSITRNSAKGISAGV